MLLVRYNSKCLSWILILLTLGIFLLTSGCYQTANSSKSNAHSASKLGPGMGYPEPQPGMLLPEVVAMKGEPELKKEAVYRGRPVWIYLYRNPLPDSIRTDITGSSVDYVYNPYEQRTDEIEVPVIESIRLRRYLITQVVFYEGEVIAVDFSQQTERDY